MKTALPRPRNAREDETHDEESRRGVRQDSHPAHEAQGATGP
jgi:hypothetical protein